MPSQTFLNLDKEKRVKLIDCAMLEFSKHEYADVSINQIIINAGIPRGSFYMYFNDKDDLFEYIVEINKRKLHKTTEKILDECNGDLFKTFDRLYDVIVEYVKKKNNKMMFKNVFLFFGMHKGHFEKPGFALYEAVKDKINDTDINASELEFIFIMLLHNLFMGITYGINNDCLDDKDIYLRKLHILCYGIYKRR